MSAPDEGKEQSLYLEATRPCDVVMKGGVTSGVVYPLAICRLARDYVFRNIGGTSAGAIAAALAAAAEYSRRKGESGFELFEGLPGWLGEGTHLLDLFQPSLKTRPLFQVLLATVGTGPLWQRIGLACWRALRYYWGQAALYGAMGVIVAVPLLYELYGTGFTFWYLVGLTVLLAASAIAIGLGCSLWTTLRVDVADNFLGMCTGFDRLRGKPQPLTDWLSTTIDAYAGVKPGPLTFGDLWSAPLPPGTEPAEPKAPSGNAVLDDLAQRATRSINLEVVTTNVTIGRPYRVPFSPLEDLVFYFDPVEFARFFPVLVVDHLKSHPGAGMKAQQYGSRQVLPLPDPQHFPVIVAARMSLSFPLLFSAVPLYAVDRSAAGTEGARVEKCWFSDGGISSNIPVHFFDNPLPRWPTFAINLRGKPTIDGPGPVAMATQNVPDLNAIPDAGKGRVPSFLESILDSMQNWVDNTQMRLPGYQERVVEIQLTGDEGGLNLEMPSDVRTRLADMGLAAGGMLAQQFEPEDGQPSAGWSEHRWVRLRSMLGMVDEWLRRFSTGYEVPIDPDPRYELLITAPPKGHWYSGFPWSNSAQVTAALHCADDLERLNRYVEALADDVAPSSGEPMPGPQLQGRPRT